MKVLFEDQLGQADFHLPSHTCVLYLSERDVIAGNGYKRKLVCFRNVSFRSIFSLLPAQRSETCACCAQGQRQV